MRFFSLKYLSFLFIAGLLHADANMAPKKEQPKAAVDTRQSCPTPAANFCSINANCANIATLIATGSVTFEGTVDITNTTPTTSCDSGALVVAGGVGIGGDLNVCGHATFGGARGGLLDELRAGVPCTGPSLEVEVLGDQGITGDLFVCGNTTINSNLTVYERVSNKIGATYTIGVDFPTIQSGIDFASSGLKPDSASNAPVLPPGAKNVTLVIPKGTYTETLFIDTSCSMPTINDPITNLPNLQGRGLRLEGDLRPIAAMTYMNGGILSAAVSFTTGIGQDSLGTANSIVALSNVGGTSNTITVANFGGFPSNTTNTTASFVQPAVLANVTISVVSTTGFTVGETVYIVGGGTYTISSIVPTTSMTVTNTGAQGNFAPGVIVPKSAAVSPPGSLQPDFVACGIVPGDVIVVSDNNGNFQQRNVVSVLNNTVTHDGSPVSLTGLGVNNPLGAALTFCPNVQVMSSVHDAVCFITSGQVEIVGIWFSGNPAFSANAVYNVTLQGSSQVWFYNLLIDSRNFPFSPVNGFFSVGSGNAVQGEGTTGNVDNRGHMSILGASLYANGSFFSFGDYYVMSKATPPNVCVQSISGNEIFANSVQVNGAGVATGFQSLLSFTEFNIFNAFNCGTGLNIIEGGNVTFHTILMVNGCTTGFSLSKNGNYMQNGAGTFNGLTPTISNCTTALSADLSSQFDLSRPLLFSNCTNGFKLTNGSKFSSSGNVLYSNVTNPYVIDATSSYFTASNAGTDPSPSNIFTYSTAGSQVMNSAYLYQLLDSAGVVNLQLTPGLSVAGTAEYIGKIYTLTAISAGPHILTLPLISGATFLDGTTFKTFTGIGSTMIIQINSASKVAILTSTGVV